MVQATLFPLSFIFVSVLHLASLAAASILPPPPALFVKESSTLPRGWTLDTRKPVLSHEHIVLNIGLVQANPTGLEDALLRVSDPASKTYGKYLSRASVLGFLAPTSKVSAIVKAWLGSHKISTHVPSSTFSISPTQDWYTVNLTVSTANQLLGATFHAYVNADTNERILRALSYSLPKSILSAVDTIQPTTIFPSGSRAGRAVSQKAKKVGDGGVVPASSAGLHPAQFPNCTNADAAIVPPWCIKKLYNVGNYAPLPQSKQKGNTIAISGFLENYAQHSDLRKYLKLYGPKAAADYTFSTVALNGVLPPQSDSGVDTEANLDVQMVAGLAYPISSTFYAVGGSGSYDPDVNTEQNSNEPYLDLQNHLLSLPDSELPSVLTTSYGDDEQSVPYEYAVRVCRGYAALGARGVTVVFSSGDMGVGPIFGGAGTVDNQCLANDGSGRTTFIPSFPATCPWVTTVGETGSIKPEVALSESSGGFSNYFPRPSYQKSAVNAYLKTWGTKYASYFNRQGRGFPDVAAQGNRIPIFDNGAFNLAFGTSAAAPMVASLVALLNDRRLRNGHPRLGFINPLLYSQKARGGFNDITKGSNPGCSTKGFKATKGWDPVSGLGTLNFGTLKDIVIPQH